MKKSLAAILSTTAIASGILFTAPGVTQPCPLKYRYRNYTEETKSVNWLNTPWAAVLTLPGIALAVSLYVRGRSQQT